NTYAKSAEICHRGDHCVRNQIIGEMPAMRVRYDLGIGKATILIADGVEVGVVQRFAGPVPRRERGGKLGAGCGMVSIEQAGAVIGERARRLAYAKVG